MGIWEGWDPTFAINTFSLIEHKAMLYTGCSKQDDPQKGKNRRFSHSTGCVIEREESHCYEKTRPLMISMLFHATCCNIVQLYANQFKHYRVAALE